jgi:hypothetical protein
MFRREALQRVGMFRESLGTAEDREFLVRLLLAGDFVYHSIPITRYRHHDNNATNVRNATRNAANGLRAIGIVLREQRERLTPDEVVGCRQALADAAHEYLAVCAQEGVAQYFAGLRLLTELTGKRATIEALQLRHLASAVLRSARTRMASPARASHV